MAQGGTEDSHRTLAETVPGRGGAGATQKEPPTMARNGFKIFDSDMHVFEPHDLYLNYMDPKWGDRIPRGEPRKRHGQVKFKFGDGAQVRESGLTAQPNVTPGEDKVAHRYTRPLARNYDAVSQVEAMDVEEDLVADVVSRIGDDNIVISTDYPHSDSRWPDAVDSFLKIDGLGESSKRKIFWDNSARLYSLQ